MNNNSKLNTAFRAFINISAILGLGTTLYALIFTTAYPLDVAQSFFINYTEFVKLGVFVISAFIIHPISDRLFNNTNTLTQ